MPFAQEAEIGAGCGFGVKNAGRRLLPGLCAGLMMCGASASAISTSQGEFWGRKAVPGVASGQSIYAGLNYTNSSSSVEVTAFYGPPTNPKSNYVSMTDSSLFAISNSCSAVNANDGVHIFYKGFATGQKSPPSEIKNGFTGALNHAQLKVSNGNYSLIPASPIWPNSGNQGAPQNIVPPNNGYNWQLSVAAAYSATTNTAFIFEPWVQNPGESDQLYYIGVTALTADSENSLNNMQTFGSGVGAFCKSPNGFDSVVDAQSFFDINGNEKILLIYVEKPNPISNYINGVYCPYMFGGPSYSIVFDPVALAFDEGTIARLPPYSQTITFNINYNDVPCEFPTFPIYGNLVQSTMSGSFLNYAAQDWYGSARYLTFESGKSNVVEFPAVWAQENWPGDYLYWYITLSEYNTQTNLWTAISPADPSNALGPDNDNFYLGNPNPISQSYPYYNDDRSFAAGVNTSTTPNLYLTSLDTDTSNSYTNIVNTIQLASQQIGPSGSEYANLKGDTYAPIYTAEQLAITSSIVSDSPMSTPTYFQNLWTIQGMVLGPPPYWPNGLVPNQTYDDTMWYGMSNVTVGTELEKSSSQQCTYQSNSSSGGSEAISFLGFGFNLSANYNHAVSQMFSQSTTSTMSLNYTVGTTSQLPPSQISGINPRGWVFYTAPSFTMQLLQGFAYDYSVSTSGQSGTPTGLSMYGMIPTNSPFTDQPDFNLLQPGTNDSCFFLAGMEGFPASTSVSEWCCPSGYNWEAPPDSEWSQVVSNLHIFEAVGAGDQVKYSKSKQTQTNDTQTNSVDFSTGLSYTFQIGKSDKNSSETTLSLSHEGGWQTSSTNTFTCGEDAGCYGLIPEPGITGDFSEIVVQPYLLQAKSPDAPWIPPNYIGALPWCMTWNVNYFQQYNAGTGGGFSSNGYNSGGIGGDCASASGSIQGAGVMQGEAAVSAKDFSPVAGKDSYTVKNGKLVYDDSKGNVRSLEMTADDFDASVGAHFRVNDLYFSAGPADGTWKRSKNVWKFNSKVDNYKLSLTLDFDKGEWSAALSKTSLSANVRPFSRSLRLELKLKGSSGSRTLVKVIKHSNSYSWSKKFTTDPSKYCLSNISASHNESSGKGTVKIEGTFPEQLDHFGDMSVDLNGSKVLFNVYSDVKDFPFLFQSGKMKSFNITDKTTKSKLSANLAKKTWTATIPSEHFTHPGPKGRNSDITATVSVGGRTVLAETFPPDKYSVKMSHTSK